MNDIKVNLSYLRLRTLLEARYGLRVVFEPLSDLKAIAKKAEDDNHLYIPVFHREHHLATVRVLEAAGLRDEHKEEILVLTEAVLRPSLIQWFERQSIHEAPAFPSAPHLHLVQDLQTKPIQTNLIWAVAHNPARIRQFAYEVHEAYECWALVQWQDIAAQVKSSHDLENLDGVTLFVPDILELSSEERDTLLAFIIKTESGLFNTLVVIGSGRSSDEFCSEYGLNSDLEKRMRLSCIHLDNIPLQSRNAVEVLRLMFEGQRAPDLLN